VTSLGQAGQGVLLINSGIEQEVDLGHLEAGQLEVEVQLELADVAQLQRHQLTVPAGGLGQPAVGARAGALLRLAHLGQADRRHLCHAEEPGRLQPTMARQNAALLIQQDRVGETELPDAPRDLPNLLIRVRARVARVRLELGDRTIGDAQPLGHALGTAARMSLTLRGRIVRRAHSAISGYSGSFVGATMVSNVSARMLFALFWSANRTAAALLKPVCSDRPPPRDVRAPVAQFLATVGRRSSGDAHFRCRS
jgi:hypothetical protein